MTKGNPTSKRPIFFDIETGGFWPSASESIRAQAQMGVASPEARPSSILSISWAQGARANTVYSQPTPESWLSRFSEEKILPQLAGKTTIPEERSIREFIGVLRQNPGAPLAGFNISRGPGFDLDFLQSRASIYGLGSEFRRLTENRNIIDTGHTVKGIIAEAINDHISNGVFSEQLGGRTLAQARLEYIGEDALKKRAAGLKFEPRVPWADQPAEYKILSQVEGFVKGGMRGKVEGWKLESIFPLYARYAGFESAAAKFTGAAHESLADVRMTQILQKGVESGKFQQFVARPEFGQEWLESVLASRVRSSQIPSDAGRIIPKVVRSVGGESAARLADDAVPFRNLKILGAAALGSVAASLMYTAFSGADDAYNTIEGLRHGGIAAERRRAMTDFGSGFFGGLARGFKAGKVAVKGIVNETIHLTKTIGKETKEGRPLAMTVTGAAIAEFAHLGHEIFSHTLTPTGAMGAAATFAATKYIYAGIKQRQNIKNTALLIKNNPTEARLVADLSLRKFGSQLADYVLRGKENELGTFIELGGGELGKQALLGMAEISSSRYGLDMAKINEDMLKDILTKSNHKNGFEGFVEKGMAAALRHSNTDFGSPWRGIMKTPDIIKRHFPAEGLFLRREHFVPFLEKIQGAVMDAPAKGFWRQSKRRKALEEIETLRSTLQELPESLAGMTFVDPQAVRGVAKQRGTTYLSELKGTIGHERFHQYVATTKLSESISMKQYLVTPELKAAKFDPIPVYAKRPWTQPEEALAFAVTNKYARTKSGARIWEPGLDMAEMELKAMGNTNIIRHMEFSSSRPAKIKKTKLGWRKRFQDFFGMRWSGKDDAYNKIEGLNEDGFAKIIRMSSSQFGSGYRGLISVPSSLAKKMKLGLGRTANLKQLKAQSLNDLADLVDDFKASGSVWEKGGEASQVNKFFKELEAAKEFGFENVMLINPEAVARTAAKTGKSQAYVTKHVIRHERVHLSRRLAAPGKSVNPAIIPDEFIESLKALNYNAGRVRSYPEEYLANLSANARYPLPLAFGSVNMATLPMQEILTGKGRAFPALAKIEEEGRNARKKLMLEARAERAIKKLQQAELQQEASKQASKKATGSGN